ncbi:MAG: alpha/beta hydrolase family protein [bacterium]
MTSPRSSETKATQYGSSDSLEYSHFRYSQIGRSLKFPLDQSEKWPGWLGEARSKLTDIIGLPQPIDEPRLAPSVQFKPVVNRPGYTRQMVTIETRPGMLAIGWLLMPEKTKGPLQAIICLPGHGRGADEIVGIDDKGRDIENIETYQHNFALQCVRRGYATLALEMIGFGHRRDSAARKRGAGASSCMPAAGAALMLGESMVGWRVWDVIRSIDFLIGLSDVESSRIGLMGISGGGTVASYAAALDSRISMAMLSGSFCTFRDSIFSVAHCIDNYVPGILKYFEVADLAAMIAPRLLFCESGSQDDIFPEPGVREAFAESLKTYQAMKAADNIGLEIFNAGHIFEGRAAFDWIKKRWS